MNHSKGPRIIIDFTDELTRQLAGERVASIIRDYIETEACVDVRGAARLLGIADSAFRRISKKLPCVDIGECTKRYRISDILAYRNKLTKQPK